MNPDFFGSRNYRDLLGAAPPSAVDRMAALIDPEAAARVVEADRKIMMAEKMREQMKTLMKEAVNRIVTPRDWHHVAMVHDECFAKDVAYIK